MKGLGRYTAECGFIYRNSILRGSILYATETMMNIKEEDFRHIEQIEEDLMRKLFFTDRSCPIHWPNTNKISNKKNDCDILPIHPSTTKSVDDVSNACSSNFKPNKKRF